MNPGVSLGDRIDVIRTNGERLSGKIRGGHMGGPWLIVETSPHRVVALPEATVARVHLTPRNVRHSWKTA